WLSITSKCTTSAPAASTASTSSPSRAKSADRMDGAIRCFVMAAKGTSADHQLPTIHGHLARERVLAGLERRQLDRGPAVDREVARDAEVREHDLLRARGRV